MDSQLTIAGTTPRTWTPGEQAVNRRHVAHALLSGAYRYGRGRLFANGCACWAGVACFALNDVHPGLIRIRPVPADEAADAGQLLFDGETACLPDAAVVALGLFDEHGSYGPTTPGEASLIDDNDHGMTFSQIAALLLDPPPGLLAIWTQDGHGFFTEPRMVTDQIELMSPGLQLTAPEDLESSGDLVVGRQAEPVSVRTARWRAVELLNGMLDSPTVAGRLGREDRRFLLDAAELEELAGRPDQPTPALQLIRAEVERIARSVQPVTPPTPRRLSPEMAAAWE